MIIALSNSKGGVGKSTLAVHLAVSWHEQGRRVALVDADVQGSSSLWVHEVAPDLPVFRLQTPDDVLEQVPLIAGKVERVVVDGPAGLSEVMRAFGARFTRRADLRCWICVLSMKPCGWFGKRNRSGREMYFHPPEQSPIIQKIGSLVSSNSGRIVRMVD